MQLDPLTIQVSQLLAYLMLTVASILVSTMSLIFGYRNNIGWEPYALITSHGLRSGGEAGTANHYGFTLNIELWNRRKYPVAIRWVNIRSTVLNFDSDVKGWEYKKDVRINRPNELYYSERPSLDPSGKLLLEIEAPFKKRTLDDLVDPLVISICYFDPRRAKNTTITVKHQYHLGALDK